MGLWAVIFSLQHLCSDAPGICIHHIIIFVEMVVVLHQCLLRCGKEEHPARYCIYRLHVQSTPGLLQSMHLLAAHSIEKQIQRG